MKRFVTASEFLIAFTAVLIITICMFYGGYMAGYTSGQTDVRREAIKTGYAEWKVDEDGYTSFAWKEGITITPGVTKMESVPRKEGLPKKEIPSIIDENMEKEIQRLNDEEIQRFNDGQLVPQF